MKKELSNLSSKLLKLHRDLLFYQAGIAERMDEKKYTPYELLTLSIHDSRFEWLRKFSELITQIDIITDDKENKVYNLQPLIQEAKSLVNGDAADISTNYKLAILENPEIALKQMEVKKALAALDTTPQ